jgi:hypothetical protein
MQRIRFAYIIKMFGNTKWRAYFSSRKFLLVDENVAYKRIINCINAVEVTNICVYIIRCK